jgi:hypothetical protein
MKLLQNGQGKKIKIQKISSKLESIIFGKLGLKDAIKNNKTFTKRPEKKREIKRLRIEVEILTTKIIKL